MELGKGFAFVSRQERITVDADHFYIDLVFYHTVAETSHYMLMCETKARGELEAGEVKAKAEAGALWCERASNHACEVGGKPWKYLLIPHDQVTEDKNLVDFLRFEHLSGKSAESG